MEIAIRFHLDEHIHPGIAVGLRAHNIEVTTTADAGLLAATDEKHLFFAYSEQRVLVTHDCDFLRHHWAKVEHSGIAYCHRDKYSVGDLMQMLLLLHACESSENMMGKVEYL